MGSPSRIDLSISMPANQIQLGRQTQISLDDDVLPNQSNSNVTGSDIGCLRRSGELIGAVSSVNSQILMEDNNVYCFLVERFAKHRTKL